MTRSSQGGLVALPGAHNAEKGATPQSWALIMTTVSKNCSMSAVKECERHGCRRAAVRKFCSQDCKIAHHNAKRDRTHNEKKKCVACGTSFIGRPNKMTCSDSCRQKLFQTRKAKARVKVPKGLRSGVKISVEKGGKTTVKD